MADQRSDPGGDGPSAPGMPQWVKVFAVVTVGLVLLVVAVMALSGGDHGPGRHLPSTGVTHSPAVSAASGMPLV